MNKFSTQNVNLIETLSDKTLHQRLVDLKSKESHIVTQIISHLQEVYRRRLYADFGCASINDYCIRILGYSNGEAYRKISACRLVSQAPEVGQAIANGEISLSNAASVQALLAKIERSQKPSLQTQYAQLLFVSEESEKIAVEDNVAEDKKIASTGASKTITPQFVRGIVNRVKNKTSRECERELARISAEFNLNTATPDPARRNCNDFAQLHICVNRDNLDDLKRELSIQCEQDLIDQLILEKLTQLKEKRSALLRIEIKPRSHKANAQARSVSPSKRVILMKKAKGRCENCGSVSRLEIDHKRSVALGGSNNIENLRVLCRSCNQRSAIQQLGIEKMDGFLRKDPKSDLK